MHLGSDSDCVNQFMQLGERLRQDGGVFAFKLTQSASLSEIFVMKPSMRKYVEIFGDFVINDGTHNLCMYGLVTMINTLVDSLGKSVMSCYSQYRSEQSEHLIRAFECFGLSRPSSTLLTDDGPAYHIVAGHLS